MIIALLGIRSRRPLHGWPMFRRPQVKFCRQVKFCGMVSFPPTFDPSLIEVSKRMLTYFLILEI